ncbi:hypothetical protein FGB62_178g030 [Gracilaria domingensis]|nr:hypothetical protein FGB62_178g030 [Gracilaria domingensis]
MKRGQTDDCASFILSFLPREDKALKDTVENGLKTLVNLSKFLEHITCRNPSLGSMGFAIYAKCGRRGIQGHSSSTKTFCLVGSELPHCNDVDEIVDIDLLEMEGNGNICNAPIQSNDGELNRIERGHIASKPLKIADSSPQTPFFNQTIRGTDMSRISNPVGRTNCPISTPGREPLLTLMPRPGSAELFPVRESLKTLVSLPGTLNLGAVRKKKAVLSTFQLSRHIVATCLSLLLDASSVTLHSSSKKPRTIASVNARVSEKIVTRIFQKQKAMKKKNGGNNMILELPSLELVRSNTEPYQLLRNERISTQVSKASKNHKETNIALLSFMLMNETGNTSIREDMETFALEGLQNCRKVLDCRKECTNRSLFKNGIYRNDVHTEDEKLGVGTVDPFATYILGQRIPLHSLLVNFEKLVNPLLLENTKDLSLKADQIVRYPVTWERSAISRVLVKSEFSKDLGTAIMVRETLVEGPVSENNNMDISYACELCDFKLFEDPKHVIQPRGETNMSHCEILSIRYPFLEWYSLKSFSHLRKKHFEKMPVTVSHLLKSRAFIWHRNYITKI